MNLKNYFDSDTKQGRPRILFTIGIPGSGKSFYTRHAGENNWARISSDELRVNKLSDMAERGEKIQLDGQWVAPDVNNPRHVFSHFLRDWVNQEIENLLRQYTEEKRNIIFDVTNVSLQRVKFMNLARSKGYYVEGFVFEPHSDLFVHLANVEKRVSEGGLDLSSSGHNARQNRLGIIRSVLNSFMCFSASMKQDRYFFQADDKLNVDFDWKKMKSTPNDYQLFLSQLDNQDRGVVEDLASHDVFNELHRIPVNGYAH